MLAAGLEKPILPPPPPPFFRELYAAAPLSPKQAGKTLLVTNQSLKQLGSFPCKGNGQQTVRQQTFLKDPFPLCSLSRQTLLQAREWSHISEPAQPASRSPVRIFTASHLE